MNDRTIKILNKLFPYAEVEEQQSFGILKIYIRLGNYFLCEFITSVIGKTDIERQISEIKLVNNFLDIQIKDAEEEKNKNEKMYRTLGIVAGMTITILLI